MTTEEDPFAAHVRDVLFPMLEQSSFYLGITPTGKPDPKFCVELGAAIMFDKPLLVVAMKGTTVPPGLRSCRRRGHRHGLGDGQGPTGAIRSRLRRGPSCRLTSFVPAAGHCTISGQSPKPSLGGGSPASESSPRLRLRTAPGACPGTTSPCTGSTYKWERVDNVN